MFWQYSKKTDVPVLGHNNTNKDTAKRRGNMKATALFSLMLALMLILSTITCAALDPIYLGFTSDVHGSTGNLTTWLQNLSVPTLERMIFGGDYEGAQGAQQCVNIVAQEYPGTDCVLVRGNHDSVNEIFVQGLVHNGPDYAIYVMDSANGSFNTNEIIALSNLFGKTIPDSKPVFVVAHHPIHSYGGRSTGNAAALLTELNKHENAIFLWGHNHTVSDPYYGKVMTKGTTINGHAEPINFTYLSYGAMRDGTGGAYGLLGTIEAAVNGTQINFDYKNLSGNTISGGSGSVVIMGDTAAGTGYELVSSPQNDETYIVVGKLGSEYYALTTEAVSVSNVNTLKGTAVTVSGNYVISSVTDDMLWKFTTSGKGFNMRNGSDYLNRRAQANAGIYLNSKSDGAGYADWIYDTGDKSLRTESTAVSDKFYALLKSSGSTYYFANDKTNKSEIYLYKLAEGGPVETYTVTFDSNGGSLVAPVNVAEGGTVSILPQPTKSGYTLDGWFTDNNTFNNEFTSLTQVTADTTVYAKWTKVELPETYYESVSSPQNDETYIVVGKLGSEYYALTTEAVSVSNVNTLKGTAVTVSGNYVISSVTDDMLWKFTTSGKGFNMRNGSDYLNRRAQANAGIYLNSKSDGAGYADWIYDTGDKSLRTESTAVSDKFYALLKSSGSTYYFANDKTNKSEIYLYKLAQVTPPVRYILTLAGDNISSVPPADLIAEGTEVTVTVAPAVGMQVATFTVNGIDKKSELVNNQYTFTIAADTIVAVAYEAIPVTQYTLSVLAVPAESGTVTGSGSYEEGANVNVTATEAEGYEFVNWTIGEEIVGTNASLIYTMPAENVVLTANFSPVTIVTPVLRIDPLQSSVSARAETVVRVKLDDAENINGVDIILLYDPAVLSVKEVKKGVIEDAEVEDFESEAGRISFAASNSEASNFNDAVVLEITFEGLASGNSDIIFEKHQLSRMVGDTPVFVSNDATPGNITVISDGTIHGFVKLSRVSGDHSGAVIIAEVGERQYTATTDVNGEFTLTGIPAGEVNLVISNQKYLTEKRSFVIAAGETYNVGTIVMKVGDIMGDNEIGLSDLTEFANAYRTESNDENYNFMCDLNEDGIVDLLDLTLFAANYRQTGH